MGKDYHNSSDIVDCSLVEKSIYTDCFTFLKRWQGKGNSEEFWEKLIEEAEKMCRHYDYHPLCVSLMAANLDQIAYKNDGARKFNIWHRGRQCSAWDFIKDTFYSYGKGN